MKVFLDANVLVSVLNKEYPVFTYSSRILSLQDNSGIINYTSPLCLAIAFYFSEKKSGTKLAKHKLDLLSRHLKITRMDHYTVADALRNKKVNDLEDGLQYYSALESDCDCIITEDHDGFYFSDLEVMDCKRFFEKHIRDNEKFRKRK